jgi:peptidoglycan/xylan/chitin deacetylase (PgdA/CDA1 family)
MFAGQLDLLRRSGFEACSLAQAMTHPGRRVAITFDDGVRSDYEHAFPALAERQMAATFFVVTDRVGSPGCVTWPELREMHAAGMAIQSHTRTHPFLSELGRAALRDELERAKATLDDALGQDTDQLALPGGDAPRRRFRGMIAEAGYRTVATSRWGHNGPDQGRMPRLIRRCTVSPEADEKYFRRLLAGDRIIGIRRRARETVLARVRAALGPSRYTAWRRRFLDAAGACQRKS